MTALDSNNYGFYMYNILTSRWLYLDFHVGKLIESFLFYFFSSDFLYFFFILVKKKKKKVEKLHFAPFLYPLLKICHSYEGELKKTRNRKTIIYSYQDTVWHHMVEFIKFFPLSCRANRTADSSLLQSLLCWSLIHLYSGLNPAWPTAFTPLNSLRGPGKEGLAFCVHFLSANAVFLKCCLHFNQVKQEDG